MNVRASFDREAERELHLEMEYYDAQQAGLGDEFLDEVARCVERIERFPESGTPAIGGLRRARISRFPFALVYRVAPPLARILAIANLHREPPWRAGGT